MACAQVCQTAERHLPKRGGADADGSQPCRETRQGSECGQGLESSMERDANDATVAVAPRGPTVSRIVGFRRSVAVVIGVDAYGDGIPRLSTAVNDARRLAAILAEEQRYDDVR